MYARGITQRTIQAHLLEIYEEEVRPEFIRKQPDAMLAKVTTWQSRPLGGVSGHVGRRVAGGDP